MEIWAVQRVARAEDFIDSPCATSSCPATQIDLTSNIPGLFLLLRLGSNPLRPKRRMRAQQREKPHPRRSTHDTVALQLCHRESHADNAGQYHLRNLSTFRVLLCADGSLYDHLRSRNEECPAGEHPSAFRRQNCQGCDERYLSGQSEIQGLASAFARWRR